MQALKRRSSRVTPWLASLLVATLAVPRAASSAPSSAADRASPGGSDQGAAAGGWAAELDAMLKAYHRQGVAPGLAAVVVQSGQVVFAKGYGVERSDQPVAMSADSSVGVGSLAKSFTALAVMQLVEQGALELDAPVQRYLPWFTTADADASARITVRMLLSNSSGLPSQDASWIWDFDTSAGAIERGVRALRGYRSKRAPGASFEYSNEGWNVLGVVIEQVSGLSYPEYLQQRVLAPLGMRRASTAAGEFARIGVLHGHWPDVDRPVAASPLYQAVAMPAGSMLHASANDLGRYLSALLAGGALDGQHVLSAAGVAQLWTPVVSMPGLEPEEGGDGEDIGYGLGWMVSTIDGRRIVHHSGASFAMASQTLIDPATRSAVSLLINTEPADHYRYQPLLWLANNVLHLVNAEPRSDFGLPRRADPTLNSYELPAARAPAYLGRYLGKTACVDIEPGGPEGLVVTYTIGPYRQRLALDFVNPAKALLRSYARTLPASFRLGVEGEVIALELGGPLQGVFGKLRADREQRGWTLPGQGRVSIPLPTGWDGRWIGTAFEAWPRGRRPDRGVARSLYGAVDTRTFEQVRDGLALGPGGGLPPSTPRGGASASGRAPLAAAADRAGGAPQPLAEHAEPVAGRFWRQLVWEVEQDGRRTRRLLYWTALAEGGFWFVLSAPPDGATALAREVAMPLLRELQL